MTLNINQFSQTTVQGQMDLQFAGSVLSGAVDASQATPLVAGQAVTGYSTSGGVPKFIAAAANNSPIFGFVARNLKDANFPAYSQLEVAFSESVMYMTAYGAVTRFANVEYSASNIGVIQSAGVNPVVGIALDTSTASGQLIRVLVKTPSVAVTTEATQTVTVTATLAQINAGLTLIPGVAGKAITVSNYIARVTGNFASGTSVDLESTNASPVIVTALAEAGLTNGAVLLPASSNTTLGAGFANPLGSGDGLQVVNIGSAQTGGTSIEFTITYQQA